MAEVNSRVEVMFMSPVKVLRLIATVMAELTEISETAQLQSGYAGQFPEDSHPSLL
ncbi:MAG: hypothetical protein GXY53_07820 [Desulfobulbus sp.]|nr:hypothetical protein [Desulfobulbus sp.]